MATRGAPRGKRQAVSGPRAIMDGRKSMKTVAVLPPELYVRVHAAAAANGLSVSGQIALLIATHLPEAECQSDWAAQLTA